jgi:hypothetical protein
MRNQLENFAGTFFPVAFSNMERSLSVIFSFCFLYFAESTGWPDCESA